jgi:tRNA pseudouridine55 synthase
VLVLLVGRATRLAQFLAGAEKEYLATVRFGLATDTGDLTGAPSPAPENARDCSSLRAEEIEAALSSLRGDIEQVPPMYSARKVQGQKLYELARRGETVERKAVTVRVREFETVAREREAPLRSNVDGTCDLDVRVVCSAGTYVRSLAESLGERLGTPAHLSSLRRTRAGAFSIDEAVTPEELQRRADDGRAGEILRPLKAALSGRPAAHLTAREAERARHGAPFAAAGLSKDVEGGAHVALFDETGELLGVAVYDAARGLLRPRVMLAGAK